MLASGSSDKTNQIERFQEYVEYLDVKQHVIQSMAKLVHSAEKKDSNTPKFRANVMRVLEVINFQDPNETKDETNTLLCRNVTYDYDHNNVRKAFSSLWEDFLKLNSKDVDLYKRMLIILHDKVMPHLIRPMLLTDFLIKPLCLKRRLPIWNYYKLRNFARSRNYFRYFCILAQGRN